MMLGTCPDAQDIIYIAVPFEDMRSREGVIVKELSLKIVNEDLCYERGEGVAHRQAIIEFIGSASKGTDVSLEASGYKVPKIIYIEGIASGFSE